MNRALTEIIYKDGERFCPACNVPLPAHETWPGARFKYCGSATCTETLRQHDHGRYVAPKTLRCEADGCTEFVPEGFYGVQASFLCCSVSCWKKRRTQRQESILCACGCGEPVSHRVRHARNQIAYVSTEHHGRHQHELFMAQAFGYFRPIVEEYFADFVPLHYRNQRSVRSALGRFFRFLNEFSYKSLNEVNCDTISKFLVWVHKNDCGVKTDLLSCISTFFKWLQATERRTSGNPVNSLLHRKKKEKHQPRPLSKDESKLAWELLHQRGDARLRLAFAIGEESGLRIGEICRLRVGDVDVEGRRLFVRLPNKTSKERYAHFGPKTAQCLAEWLGERDRSCGHDCLLYNYFWCRTPFTQQSLARAFKKALLKSFEGMTHDRGFDKWSTHRLRHTMGTNLVAGGADAAVVMAAGGWVDPDTMAGYVKVNETQAKRGYAAAMRRAEEQKHEAPKRRVLTPQEFLQYRRGGKQEAENSRSEHVV